MPPDFDPEQVQADKLIAMADGVVAAEVTGAGDAPVREGVNPRLVHFRPARRYARQRLPGLTKIVGPGIASRAHAADQDSVASQADRFRNLAGVNLFQKARCELLAVAVNELPAGV